MVYLKKTLKAKKNNTTYALQDNTSKWLQYPNNCIPIKI